MPSRNWGTDVPASLSLLSLFSMPAQTSPCSAKGQQPMQDSEDVYWIMKCKRYEFSFFVPIISEPDGQPVNIYCALTRARRPCQQAAAHHQIHKQRLHSTHSVSIECTQCSHCPIHLVYFQVTMSNSAEEWHECRVPRPGEQSCHQARLAREMTSIQRQLASSIKKSSGSARECLFQQTAHSTIRSLPDIELCTHLEARSAQ